MPRTSTVTRVLFTLAVIAVAMVSYADGFGLPGLAANAYKKGSALRVEVNDIRSTKNPVQFNYYNKYLPYHSIKFSRMNRMSTAFDLGSILAGERHQLSPYVLSVLQDECISLGKTTLTASERKRTLQLIKRQYRVQMLVDGLPAMNNGTRVLRGECESVFYRRWPKLANYQRGYYVGVPQRCAGYPMLNNHVHFDITVYPLDATEAKYFSSVSLPGHSTVIRQTKKRWQSAKKDAASITTDPPSDEELFLVVGVTVTPYSINWGLMATENMPVTSMCRSAPESYTTVDAEKIKRQGNGEEAIRMAAVLATDQNGNFGNGNDADDDNNQGDDDQPDAGFDDDGEDDAGDGNNFDADDFNEAGAGDGEEEEGKAKATGASEPSADPLHFLAKVNANRAQKLPEVGVDTMSIEWTYSVRWRKSRAVKWATRWDAYFKEHPLTVKQSSYMLTIVLSAAIITALLSLVVGVLVRALRRDLLITAPIFLSPEDEQIAKQEENGWKAVRGDVFRPPARADLLALVVSTGTQGLFTLSLVVFFGLFGFASPSNRGGLTSLLLFFSLLSSFVGGAFCAWLTLALGQPKRWKTMGAFVFGVSGAFVLIFTGVNVILRLVGSSGAIPVAPMLTLYALWLFIYCPLGFFGAASGFATRYKPSAKVAAVNRTVDYSKVWSLFRPPGVLLYSGIPPFFVGTFLMRVILNGLWGGVMFYVFGFVCVTGSLWILSCALTSISVVYYNLCGENHRWHWLSVVAPTSGGLHSAVFVVWYFFAYIRSTTMTAVLVYFIYMTLFSLMHTAIGGAVGFLSSFTFVHFIYNSAKSD